MNIPQELLSVYAEIIKNEPSVEAVSAHLMNFLLDANKVVQVIEDAVNQAKQRLTTPVEPPVASPSQEFVQ